MIDILLQKIFDLLTGYFTSIKNKLTYLYENISTGESNELILLDSDMLDDIGPSVNTFDLTFIMPYLFKMSLGVTYTSMPKIFNLNNVYYFGRDYYKIASIINPIKVESGKYKKLVCDVQVINDGSSDKQAKIFFTDTFSFDEVARPLNNLKEIVLVSKDKTSEEINNQSGVVINSTTPTELARQTVEINIEDLTDDFYIGFWNVDVSIYFRSIKLVK